MQILFSTPEILCSKLLHYQRVRSLNQPPVLQ
jgi:hypothetical protein